MKLVDGLGVVGSGVGAAVGRGVGALVYVGDGVDEPDLDDEWWWCIASPTPLPSASDTSEGAAPARVERLLTRFWSPLIIASASSRPATATAPTPPRSSARRRCAGATASAGALSSAPYCAMLRGGPIQPRGSQSALSAL